MAHSNGAWNWRQSIPSSTNPTTEKSSRVTENLRPKPPPERYTDATENLADITEGLSPFLAKKLVNRVEGILLEEHEDFGRFDTKIREIWTTIDRRRRFWQDWIEKPMITVPRPRGTCGTCFGRLQTRHWRDLTGFCQRKSPFWVETIRGNKPDLRENLTRDLGTGCVCREI